MNYMSFICLVVSMLSVAASIMCFLKKQEKLSIILLLLSAIFIRLFVIYLDPFLHDWDERFHALVAKNIMDTPFKPTLREYPVLPYNFEDWTGNHVWLHKQPLFLWQIMLSFKLFGVNEIALRIPSVIQGVIQIFILYRMGKILFGWKVAYIAAALLTFSYYQLELTCGRFGIDHNDISFSFYVTCSLWAFIEYQQKKDWKWLIAIGIFAGAAVLVKWLTGLIVYLIWAIFIFFQKKERSKIKNYLHGILSFLVCLCIFLPWQIYILNAFPQESKYEYWYNSQHIFHGLEGQRGNKFFYLNLFTEHYGYWQIFALFLGIWILIKNKNKSSTLILLGTLLPVYFFFSVVVVTKMSNYVFVVSPMIFIIIGLGIYSIFQYFDQTKYFKFKGAFLFIVLFGLVFSNLWFPKIMNNHFGIKDDSIKIARENKIYNTEIYKKLDSIVPGGYLIFNTSPFENIDAMFYSDFDVYHWWLSENEFTQLKSANYKFAVFKIHGTYKIPDYILEDDETFIIPFELK